MWQLKPRLFTQLAELVDLLREQNSLLREWIEATTKRPARTPISRTGYPLPPRVAGRGLRPFTAADVSVSGTGRKIPQEPQLPIPTAPEPEIDET